MWFQMWISVASEAKTQQHQSVCAHAAGHELRMDVGEYAQIGNAAATNFVHQSFDAAEILDPQRNGRMFKQPSCILLAQGKRATGRLARRDVFQRNQDAAPVMLVTR